MFLKSRLQKTLKKRQNSNIWRARKKLKNSQKTQISEENFGKGLGRAVKVPIIEQLLNNEIMGPLSETKKTVSETACLIRGIKKSSIFELFIIEFFESFSSFSKKFDFDVFLTNGPLYFSSETKEILQSKKR